MHENISDTMTVNLNKLFELFEEEEERRCQENKLHPETLFMEKEQNKYRNHYERFIEELESHEFGKTTLTGENFDSMKRYGITKDEASLVYMYTIDMHSDVNRKLRNGEPLDKDEAEYVCQLELVLRKLPSFSGVVHRDISHPDCDIIEKLEFYEKNIGKEVTEHAFMSSHKDTKMWRGTKNGFGIKIFTKCDSNGRDLSEFSFNANEEEVLFLTNTKLKIERIDFDTNTIFALEV